MNVIAFASRRSAIHGCMLCGLGASKAYDSARTRGSRTFGAGPFHAATAASGIGSHCVSATPPAARITADVPKTPINPRRDVMKISFVEKNR